MNRSLIWMVGVGLFVGLVVLAAGKAEAESMDTYTYKSTGDTTSMDTYTYNPTGDTTPMDTYTFNPTGDTTPMDTGAYMFTYVCPMHSEVTSEVPGTCSKCGMGLVVKSPVRRR